MLNEGKRDGVPGMLSVVQAAEVLGIGRTLAYQLVHRAMAHPGRAGGAPRSYSCLVALASTGSTDRDPYAA